MDGSNGILFDDATVPAPLAGAAASEPFELAERDAVAWLSALPASSVDLVITDPPYESLEKHRAIGTTTRLKHSKASSNDWFSIFPNHRFPELFAAVYRVLKRDSHFYLFADQETMFVAKPIAEAAGFKFWKPIVWDKCIAPDTPVWTSRGVLRAADVRGGDCVMTPAGRLVEVLATRTTSAPALRIALSDGTHVIASREHRFGLPSGADVEACELQAGMALGTAQCRAAKIRENLPLAEITDEDERILEMPDPSQCLFCGRKFESKRAAAAHQARFCEGAVSKATMADELGVAPKRLRRWMSEGRLPARWAETLGLATFATGRSRLALQNDAAHWFPDSIPLDYSWGKLVGLFAAEGSRSESTVSFTLHSNEKHLQSHVARTVRQLGLRAKVTFPHGEACVVLVMSKFFSKLVGTFVGGTDATSKYLRPTVYEAPHEFRRGVFDGIVEGDGCWSHDEQRETVNIASRDLAAFVHRFARELGFDATIRRYENETAGFWRVRFDPEKKVESLRVVSVEEYGPAELIDLAIDDPRQLYLLGNGLLSHNCRIGMGYHYRSRYELILFFEKGKRRLIDLGVADIITHPRIARGYPAEKPVEVSEVLVRQSSSPGDVVADPFMGSGSVGVASLRLGRRFIGTDTSPSARELTERRLSAEVAPIPTTDR